MRKLLSLGLVLTALQFSCSSPEAKEKAPTAQEKVEAFQDQVMAQHDSVMTHMGALYRQRKNLEQLKDSLVAQGDGSVTELEKGIADLAAAEEGMMQWMRTYRKPDASQPDSAMAYLNREKAKITIVQQDITLSLEKAQNLSAQFTSK